MLGSSASLVEPARANLRRAEELLEQRGWTKGADGIREKDGRKLSLVSIAQFDFEPESLQFMQAQARRAGIDLRMERAPDGAAYAKKINAGEFDVDVNYWNQNDANPARIVSLLWYGKADSARIKFTGVGEEFDRAVDEALAAPDTNAAARKAAEAMEILLEQQVGAIPLTSFPQIFALKAGVAGFTPHPSVNHQPWTTVYRTR